MNMNNEMLKKKKKSFFTKILTMFASHCPDWDLEYQMSNDYDIINRQWNTQQCRTTLKVSYKTEKNTNT